MPTNFAELLPMIIDQIEAGGEVRFRPRGISMLPFLMEGRDEVILTAPPEKLKKGDIPFYRRTDGAFVLHRVVDIAADGTYVLCGDNQSVWERGITHEQVIAVVKAVYRKGKYIESNEPGFRIWGAVWPKYKLVRGKLGRVYHKIRKDNK